MKVTRVSVALLLGALVFLFIPTIVELIGGPEVDSHITQLIGFTLTLLSIFGNAYFDATRLERQFEEQRKSEIRSHQMKMLDQIEF